MQQYEQEIWRGHNSSGFSKEQVQYTLLTSDGRTVQGSNYDWVDDIVTNESVDEAKAFAAHYHVGQSYPCWYNPLFPSVSALSRAPDASRLPSTPNASSGGFYPLMYFVGYIAIGLLLFLLICILPVVIVLNVVLRSRGRSQSGIAP